MKNNRRKFLATAGVAGLAAALPAYRALRAKAPMNDKDNDKEKEKGEKEAEISAPEDLMREHGVLNRILLIYEEASRRLRAKQQVPPEVFHRPATMVRKFVEEYHEQLEQNFIFPEFEKRGKLVDLVSVLRRQHEAGRRLTDVILRLAAPAEFVKADARDELCGTCDVFIRMYRPHEAREDTVLFPTLYEILSQKEIAQLGERFEEQEHRLFGEEGFQKNVEQVAAVEKQLDIYDLASFTPK